MILKRNEMLLTTRASDRTAGGWSVLTWYRLGQKMPSNISTIPEYGGMTRSCAMGVCGAGAKIDAPIFKVIFK